MANVIENFEDTTYAFPITFGGWTRSNTDKRNGAWSMRSPVTTAASTTYTATVTVPAGATAIRFWWKVSSEANYDFFRFYLGASGGTPHVEGSGELPWSQTAQIPLSGNTKVRFIYTKDGSGDNGANAAWVDDIEFIVPNKRGGWGPLPAF